MGSKLSVPRGDPPASALWTLVRTVCCFLFHFQYCFVISISNIIHIQNIIRKSTNHQCTNMNAKNRYTPHIVTACNCLVAAVSACRMPSKEEDRGHDTSSSEESVEEERVPPPPPPPPYEMIAKAKAGPPRGTRYDSDVESTESSASQPRAEAVPSANPKAADHVPGDDPPPPWHGKGKGKGYKGRIHCPICWRPISNYSSGQQQHRYYRQTCLQWQRYLRGGISWHDAGRWAEYTKNRRCDWEEPHVPEGNPEAASSEPRRNRTELKLTERKEREDRESKEKKHRKDKKEKKEDAKKAEKKKKKKVRREEKWLSPSPSPPGKGKRGRKPPSSSDDEGGHGKPVIRQVGPGTFLVMAK